MGLLRDFGSWWFRMLGIMVKTFKDLDRRFEKWLMNLIKTWILNYICSFDFKLKSFWKSWEIFRELYGSCGVVSRLRAAWLSRADDTVQTASEWIIDYYVHTVSMQGNSDHWVRFARWISLCAETLVIKASKGNTCPGYLYGISTKNTIKDCRLDRIISSGVGSVQ